MLLYSIYITHEYWYLSTISIIFIGVAGAEASASPEEGRAWKEAECCLPEPHEDHQSTRGRGQPAQEEI